MTPSEAATLGGGCHAGRKVLHGEAAWLHWLHCVVDWTVEYSSFLTAQSNNMVTPSMQQSALQLADFWREAEKHAMAMHQAASSHGDDTPAYLWIRDFLNATSTAYVATPQFRSEYLRKPYESLLQLVKYKVLNAPNHRQEWEWLRKDFENRLSHIR